MLFFAFAITCFRILVLINTLLSDRILSMVLALILKLHVSGNAFYRAEVKWYVN